MTTTQPIHPRPEPYSQLVLSSETFALSTRSSAGTIMNPDPNYKSHIRFVIPDFVRKDETVLYQQFSIPYVVIPVSFFNINEYNNTLDVSVNGISTSYTIPEGGYNINTLISALETALGIDFDITFNSDTLYLSVSHTTYDFSFLGTSTIDYVLGFSNTQTSTSLLLTMPRIVNLFPPPVVHIRCPELARNDKDIILTVPTNVATNGQIVYQNNSQMKTMIRRDNINTITLRITDDDDNPLNFHGLSSFFTIEIETARKVSQVGNNFREFVNILRQNPDIYDFPMEDPLILAVPRLGGILNGQNEPEKKSKPIS